MRRENDYRCVCPCCGGSCDPLRLSSLGGKVREPMWDRDGREHPAVRVLKVLCWWCRLYHSPEEVSACMALPEKREIANGASPSQSTELAKGLLEPFSELWEFLTALSYPDGRKRKPGRLSLCFERGYLGVTLTDDETGQYAYLNGLSLDDLLLEAESRLGDGSLHWRPSRYAAKKK